MNSTLHTAEYRGTKFTTRKSNKTFHEAAHEPEETSQ
jgi:hypothetical protein